MFHQAIEAPDITTTMGNTMWINMNGIDLKNWKIEALTSDHHDHNHDHVHDHDHDRPHSRGDRDIEVENLKEF